MMQGRDGGQAPRRAPSRPLPLNLIHTTNCSTPLDSRAYVRFSVSIRDPQGIAISDLPPLLRGLLLARQKDASHATKATPRP